MGGQVVVGWVCGSDGPIGGCLQVLSRLWGACACRVGCLRDMGRLWRAGGPLQGLGTAATLTLCSLAPSPHPSPAAPRALMDGKALLGLLRKKGEKR